MVTSRAIPSAVAVSRGPILLAVAIGSLLLPYAFVLSTKTLVYIFVLGLGLFFTVRDASCLIERCVRQQLAQALNALVVDDVMRSIFDPEIGWFTGFVSTLLGNATIYTLPMTTEHRVRLIQSCLWTSEEQTRRFLTAPGGVKEVLPDSFRKWLDGKETERPAPIESVSFHEASESEASQTSNDETDDHDVLEREDTSDILKANEGSSPRGFEAFLEPKVQNRKPRVLLGQSTQLPRSPTFESPIDAMGGILQEITLDTIKMIFRNVPDTSLQAVGIAATACCAWRVRSSPRARRIVAGAAEATFAATMASAAIGAIGTLLLKHYLHSKELRTCIPGRTSIFTGLNEPGFLATLQARMGKNISRHWKGTIAIIVLFLVGRMRKSHPHIR